MQQEAFAKNTMLFILCFLAMAKARNVTLSVSRPENTLTKIIPSIPGYIITSSSASASSSSSSLAFEGNTATTASINQTQLEQVRRNIIRGSNLAVTITKMKYLKKEMCKSAPLQQAVRHRGCLRRIIINRFCYGQCNSFFIPKTIPRDNNDEASLEDTAFKSCSFCRPKIVRWVRVLLQCPRLQPARSTRKKVQIVMQCSCTALAIN